jgi:AAA family ATP:ADP antiporter
MLALHPLWSALVSRLPRRRVVRAAYRFFGANLVAIFFLLGGTPGWLPQALFYVWASVFSLMAVAIFWSFMTDVWSTEQGKRLFGVVSLGGGLGAICGPLLTAALVRVMPPHALLLVAVGILELGTFCLGRVARAAEAAPVDERRPAGDQQQQPDEPLGGGVLSGLAPLIHSRYLAAAAGFMALGVISATFNIYLQAHLIAALGIRDQAALTGLYARLDLGANLLTALAQGLLAAPLLSRWGPTPVLVALPVLSVLGFGAAAVAPTLVIVGLMQVLRRATAYGLLVPTYGVLFTLVSREERYKVRTFIDTVIYRGGDLAGGWAFATLLQLGLGLRGMAAVAGALALPWLAVALGLDRMQRRLTGERAASGPAEPQRQGVSAKQ